MFFMGGIMAFNAVGCGAIQIKKKMEQARDLNDILQSSDHQEDWNVSRFNQKLGSEAQNLAFMLAFVVFTAFCIMLPKIRGWLTDSDPHGALCYNGGRSPF